MTSQILKILNCFSTNTLAAGAVSITLAGIRNPPSYKPSNSFKIRSYSPTPTLLNYINTSLIVQMNTAYTITTFDPAAQTNTVHATSLYNLNIVHIVPC